MGAQLPPAGPRRYTDREVRTILESAVELQQRAADGDDPSGGMSLVELEQVAAEAGIDPALLRRAAAALDAPAPSGLRDRFPGAAAEIVVERTVERALDAREFEDLVAIVRARTGVLGELHHVGRLFGWRGRIDGARAEVSVSPWGAGSQIRIRIQLEEQALGQFMLKGTLVGGGGGLVTATGWMAVVGPVGLVVGGIVAAGGYVWARRSYQRVAVRFRARAAEVADSLAAHIAERERMVIRE